MAPRRRYIPSMLSILVFQYDDNVPPGYLGEELAAAGCVVDIVRCDRGDPVPDELTWDGIVSLGGPMGAYDEADHPYLAEVKQYLRRAVDGGVPTLGLCLGCQLLADALGGSAFLAPSAEVAFTAPDLTDAGRTDPVVAHLDNRSLVFHQDTWALPPGATLLATTDRYPQAFRLGSAIGVQPHPEVTPEILAAWTHRPSARRVAENAGSDLNAILAEYAAAADTTRAMARNLFGAWIDEVAATAATAEPPTS